MGSVFEEIVYHRSLNELIDEGHLLAPQAVAVNVEEFHPRHVVDVWREHVRGPGRKSTLVFGDSISAVRDITREFLAAGVTAAGITGDTEKTVRASAVQRFRRQELSVLVNCAVFTEGTDIPCVDTVILARGTRSEALFQQMVGRGLRQFPGKENCLVVDMCANVVDNSLSTSPHLQGLVPEYDLVSVSDPALLSAWEPAHPRPTGHEMGVLYLDHSDSKGAGRTAHMERDSSADTIPASVSKWPEYAPSRLVRCLRADADHLVFRTPLASLACRRYFPMVSGRIQALTSAPPSDPHCLSSPLLTCSLFVICS